MNNDQITALAREYAEEIRPYNDKTAPLSILDIREAERLIRFLLRRFALVEKSKVKQLKQCFGSEEVYEVIDMLFPDLGKEVENNGR